MIGPCPAGIDPDALARDVLASADCLITAQVEQGYAALLAPGGSLSTALTIALTIYVAIFGYRLMLGLSSLTLGEVVPHFVKIGVVLALVTSWPSYQTLVFDLLFDAPQQLASTLTRQAAGAAAGPGDIMAALQSVFERLTDAAGDAWKQGAPVVAAATPAPAAPVAGAATTPPPAAIPQMPFALGASQFVAALLWLSALVLMAMSVGVLLVVRIVLALLLVIGPVFIALALFRPTRGFAEGWLRTTVKFALVPLFALPLIAAVVATLAPLASTLGDAPITSVRDGPVLLILLVTLVFAAVMVQAARLGGSIAGSIRLPRGPAASPASERIVAPVPGGARAEPLAVAGRAETIVRAIDSADRRAAGGAGTPALSLTATRMITAPGSAPAPQVDNSNRLGQGYRRLAVAGAAPRPRT